MKKIISVILSLVLIIAFCMPAAGFSRTKSAADNTELVNLKFYFVGDKYKDTDTVLEKINQKLKEKLNTTISLEYISWGDFSTKYPLLFAAGDDFDAIFTADWAFYTSQAQKNGFLELTPDLLKKYAPLTWANTSKTDWDSVKVDGKIFMVPQDIIDFNQRMIIIRGDLREKYKVPPIKDFYDAEKYLDIIAKNEKSIAPLGMLSTDAPFLRDFVSQKMEWAIAGGNSNFTYAMYKITDPKSGRLINILDSPEYMKHLRTIRSWNQKGYIPKSTLTNRTGTQDMIKNGLTAMMVQNYGTGVSIYNDFIQKHPSWKVEVIDGTFGKKVLTYPAISGGLGIHATTKYADRVLEVTDYLRNDKEMNLLAQRGIQGVNWELGGDGKDINITKPGPKASDYGDSFTWGPWRNSKFQAMHNPCKYS